MENFFKTECMETLTKLGDPDKLYRATGKYGKNNPICKPIVLYRGRSVVRSKVARSKA